MNRPTTKMIYYSYPSHLYLPFFERSKTSQIFSEMKRIYYHRNVNKRILNERWFFLSFKFKTFFIKLSKYHERSYGHYS